MLGYYNKHGLSNWLLFYGMGIIPPSFYIWQGRIHVSRTKELERTTENGEGAYSGANSLGMIY